MKDPLAGKRAAINAGEITTLTWPDEGKGPPVKRGEFFLLRACGIEITSVRRVGAGLRAEWRATFRRIPKPQKPHLLAPAGRGGDTGHGYVRRARGAMPSGEERPDWHVVEGDEVPSGPPPEPEAVPPEEVRELPTSVAAQARFEEIKREELRQERALPLAVRLERLRRLARERHIDISAEERVIERRIAAIEKKVYRQRDAA